MLSVIAVGGDTNTAVLTGGDDWSNLALQGDPFGGTVDFPRSVAWTGQQFVVACESGQILRSATGAAGSWSQVDTGLTENLRVVVQFGSRTLVFGGNGGLAISTDHGATWDDHAAEFGSVQINGAAVGDGTLVVVGDSGGSVWSSTTGLDGSYTSQTLPNFGNSANLQVAYGNAQYVIAGQGGRTWWADESDLTSWTYEGNPSSGVTCQSVAYGNGRWVQVCGVSASQFVMVTATVVTSWSSPYNGPVSTRPRAVIYDSSSGLWVVCGNGGFIRTTTDPTTAVGWSTATSGTTEDLWALWATDVIGDAVVPPEGPEFTPPRGRVQALFRHHPLAEPWTAESTAGERDVWPGEVTEGANNQGSMRLIAGGEWDDPSHADDVSLVAVSSGYPGSGASVRVTQGGNTYGLENWNIIDERRPIVFSSSTEIGWTALAVQGERAISITGTDVSSTVGVVTLYTRTDADETWGLGTLAVNLGGATLADYSDSDRAPFPAVCGLADGRVLLGVLRFDEDDGASVTRVRLDTYHAPADADWSSSPFVWSGHSNYLSDLGSALSVLGLHLTATAGQVLAVLEVHNTSGSGSTTFLQFVSTDGGAKFSRVSSAFSDHTSNESRVGLTSSGGFFLMSYSDDANLELKVMRFADATEPFSLDNTTTVDPGGYFGSTAMVVAENGDTLLFAQDGAGGADGIVVFRSIDGGRTWSKPALIAKSESTKVGCLAATAWRERVLLSWSQAPDSSYDLIADAVTVGGWSTWTMPEEFRRDEGPLGTVQWTGAWIGLDEITTTSGEAGWDNSATGSPTTGFTGTGGDFSIACGGSDTWAIVNRTSLYSYTPKATIVRVLGARVTAGTAEYGIDLSGGHQMRVEQDPDELRVYDAASGGSLVSTVALDTAEHYDVILWVNHEDDDAACLYRPCTGLASAPGQYARRVYTQIDVNPTAGSTNISGIVVPNNTTLLMRGAFYAQLPYAYDLDPAEPYSIDVRSNATHVYNGARAQFRGGPTVRGDTFEIGSASETPYEYAAATAEAPSPRMRWESDGTSGEYIAWRLSSTTDEDRESPVWGVWLETNASAVRLDWRVDGSWVEGPAVKAEEVVTMDVVGRYAVASTMRLGVTYVQRGELAGGLAWSSTAGEWIEIEDNTEGILQYQEGALLARVRLAEDADGDRITRISFPRSCALLDSADVPEALQGFRLKLDEGTAAPPTRYNLKCNIGPAVVLGHPHGRDSRDTYSPRRASATAANGMRMTHREGPTDYRRTITWQDQPEPWTYQALRDTAQPSSLYDSQDVPVFARGSMAATVAHLVSEWGADGVPVVYVPRWEPASGSVVYQTHRAGGSELATIEDEFIVEHAGLGDEQVNPLVRGGAINLQRLT